MADRGRDLKFSILSDLSQFDTDQAARQLDDLGDSSEQVARRVDDAFDRIAKSSRTSLRQKLDDDTDSAKRSLRDVRDEANDTAREMAASFDGSASSVVDAFQELGANAGQAFGPVGIAAGAAAAVGVGLIRAEQQKLKETTQELVEDMLEAGGKLTDAVVDQRISRMVTEDAANFVKYDEAAQKLGVSLRDVTRARAGDGEAAARLIAKLDELDKAQRDEAKAAGNVVAQRANATASLNGLRAEIELTARATELAARATNRATDATSTNVAAAQEAAKKVASIREQLAQPINIKIGVSGTDVPRQLQLLWLEADRYFQQHPITLRTKPGGRPFRDVP